MIVYDLIPPAVTTGYVRNLPVPPEVRLNAYLPDVVVSDIQAVVDKVNRTNRAAMFRAWDAETPIGKRDTARREKVELPPIGQKLVLGEYDRLQLNRLQGANNLAQIEAAIYDDIDVNARAVQIRVEVARGDVLTDGKFTLTGENGLTLECDFGVPAGNLVSASTVWSNHTSSDPLTDLQGWIQTYQDLGGDAGRMVTSTVGLNHMLQNQTLRQLASVNGFVPSTLNRNQLNAVFEAYGLPPVEVYNGRFDVGGSTTRAIPQDRLVILPSNPTDLGRTVWGITAESLELAEANQLSIEAAPGLVSVIMKDGDPVRRWTKVGGTVMPVLDNPDRLMVADIF